MGKHKTSFLMLVGALLFYLIFGVIVPDVFYGSPEDATRPMEHAAAGLGQVLRKIAPLIALILGLFAGARFVKEMQG